MQGTILVTGATGNVGREVIPHLLRADARVRGAVPDPEKARAQGPQGVEWVRFDFDDASTHGPALEGVEKLVLVRPPSLAERTWTPPTAPTSAIRWWR